MAETINERWAARLAEVLHEHFLDDKRQLADALRWAARQDDIVTAAPEVYGQDAGEALADLLLGYAAADYLRVLEGITVTYSSIDGARKTRRFKSLEGARAFACKWVGEHPEVGTGYAVSADGVGKVTVSGATLAELFPARS
jgi:hypothetical protein